MRLEIQQVSRSGFDGVSTRSFSGQQIGFPFGGLLLSHRSTMTPDALMGVLDRDEDQMKRLFMRSCRDTAAQAPSPEVSIAGCTSCFRRLISADST